MPSSDDRSGDPPNVHRLGADSTAADLTAGLEQALGALESKMQSSEGLESLAAWLHEVDEAIASIERSDLDRTCEEIKSLIDQLLGINAHIQNLKRLKKLLA